MGGIQWVWFMYGAYALWEKFREYETCLVQMPDGRNSVRVYHDWCRYMMGESSRYELCLVKMPDGRKSVSVDLV